jgi:hypothetical protein
MGAPLAELERRVAQMDRVKHAAFGYFVAVDVVFLKALVAARGCGSASVLGRARRIAHIGLALRTLNNWARSCPANFEPFALILHAELLRVLGQAPRATRTYERAIASCLTHGTTKREAIACELASKHACACGNPVAAERYRRRAADAYRRWGATAKARALEAAAAPSDRQ